MYGRILFENKKAPTLVSEATKTNGIIIFRSESPEDFNATSSKCSPRFPKVINDESKMESGSASGNMDNAA